MILLVLACTRCVQEEPNLPVTGWSSLDPASIPLRQRMVQYNRGNLVRNPSFEQGRIINIDSNTVSYNITGWRWEGEQVQWYYDDSGSMSKEVRSGEYSIKVVRRGIDETINRGHGVLSDFIRIMPGNYELTYWTRLEDIQPYKERLGTRLYDAVDIRLLFYDKNMLLINGHSFHPALNLTLDQSFKAQPFAHYWTIDSLGWAQIRGRTTNDFQIEGDVPDEARYVKLFFGLKGPGTMWIDDVDFRYTRRNFTPLEKSRRYFDTTSHVQDLLVPRPKSLEVLPPLTWYLPGTDSLPLPVILIAPQADRPTLAAADLLKRGLDTLLAAQFGTDSMPGIEILQDPARSNPETGRLILCIGTGMPPDDSLHERLWKALPANPDAYRITQDTARPHIVYLIGREAQGNYYAASTLLQLFDRTRCVLHSADVTDYPDVAGRGFLASPLAATSTDYQAFLENMTTLKMNWAYMDHHRSRALWSAPATQYRRGIQSIASTVNRDGMLHLAQMINPYAFFQPGIPLDSVPQVLRGRWTHASSRSRTAVQDLFSEGLKAGVRSLVVCTQDYLPHERPGNYGFYAKADRMAFINLQAAHLNMLEETYAWMKSSAPDAMLEFIPPWYANEMIDQSRGQAEQYFHDLFPQLEDEVRLAWSGPTTRSFVVDAADIERFHGLTGRLPVLLDQSLDMIPEIIQDPGIQSYPPMKLKTLSLFEPYAVHFPGPFQWSGPDGKILINSDPDSEMMRIRLATAADFLWNARDYDPDHSLWCVLVSRYGKTAAMELYRFNDAYFSLWGSMIALKQDNGNQKLARQVQAELRSLNASLKELDGLLISEPALLNELKLLKNSLEKMFEEEVENIAKQLLASLSSMR